MHRLIFPGNLVLLAAVLGAAVLALWLEGSAVWTSGVGVWLAFMGRLTGVLGAVMLLLAAVVSIRVPKLDLPFGGLPELWKVHHVLGFTSFLLLMLHPILLALSNFPMSPQAAAAVLIPERGETAAWLGWGSLLAMMVFLSSTFYFFGQPHYQRWKLIHAISALTVVLGIAHTLIVARTLPISLWWLMTGLAAAALAYRLVFRKLRPGRRFKISEVVPLVDGVVEIGLVPEKGPQMEFEPGQFIYLSPLDPKLGAGRRQEHPYTISSAPGESHLRTAVKSLGDASEALQHVAVGSSAWVDGPYGRFFEPVTTGPELWIGGGIGITPFVSRARALRSNANGRDIHLVYCANMPSRAYYLGEFDSIAGDVSGFRVSVHYFYEEGALNQAWLERHVPDFAKREVYICGPDELIQPVVGFCRREGIPAGKIHSEAFTFL